MKTEIRIQIEDRSVELLKDDRVIFRHSGIHTYEQGMMLALNANAEIEQKKVVNGPVVCPERYTTTSCGIKIAYTY